MNILHWYTAFFASGIAFISLWDMTGRESAGALLLGYGGGWFLLYAVAAAVPMLFNGPWRELIAAFIAFGIGGGVSCGLIVAVFPIADPPGLATGIVFLSIPFWLPWIVGAVIMYLRHPEIPIDPPLGTPMMNALNLYAGFVASGIAFTSLWSTTGRERAGALLLGYGGGWFLLYAVAAAVPRLFNVPWRELIAPFIAFGIGGGVTGGLMVAVRPITDPPVWTTVWPVAVVFSPFWLPWIVGAIITYLRHSGIPRDPRVDH